MKRLFASAAALALSLVAATTTLAQVQIGFRGGANWSTVSEPQLLRNLPIQPELSPGPMGGIFLEIPLSERVSFRPELNYVQKGFLLREGTNIDLGIINLPIGARVAYQTNNVQAAPLLKINLADGPVQPYLIAGPAISYAADGRIRTRATALFTSRPMDVDLDFGNTLNAWDFSGIGGLGLAAEAGRGRVFVEARYEYGFTRQLQVPLVQLPVRNRGLGVSVGYAFTL
jgi:hypothetical protein